MYIGIQLRLGYEAKLLLRIAITQIPHCFDLLELNYRLKPDCWLHSPVDDSVIYFPAKKGHMQLIRSD